MQRCDKYVLGGVVSLLGAGVVVVLVLYVLPTVRSDVHMDAPPAQTPSTTSSVREDEVEEHSVVSQPQPAQHDAAVRSDFVWPLARATERITAKPFGILIDPRTSPVQPERFAGYHTGTDFEALPDDTQPVVVHAICDGVVRVVQRVRGYGGVVVQECRLGDAPITVVYGHIIQSATTARVGDRVAAGDVLTTLGAPYSTDTDGERQHLHLGIHKTDAIVFAGYVPRADQLTAWMDATQLIAR